MRLLLLMSIITSLEALHCDKQFNFIDYAYEKGYDIICQGLTNKHIGLLQNISSVNEISVKIENSTLTDVTSKLFQNVANIKKLYIQDSTFNFSQTEAIFETLRNLEILTVTNTKFAVTKSSLSRLFHVKKLILNNNGISSVEQGSFDDLELLTTLQITENNLRDLSSLNLCVLKNVKTLNFSKNHIVNLGQVFYCENNRNEPMFEINNIKSQNIVTNDYVTPSVFSTELNQIDLSFNEITDLSISFALLRSLKIINLRGNHLNRINSSYLKYLEYLEDLQISDNFIEVLDDDAFDNKLYLEKLDISNNKIQRINLMYLSSVTQLNLRNNSIDLDSFLTMNTTNELVDLFLDSNRITWIKPNIFSKLKSLQKLSLCDNNISLTEESFGGLNNLFNLYLRDSNIQHLPIGVFKDLQNLRLLDLSGNKLDAFNYDTFNSLKNLEILNISRNSLTSINFDLMKPLDGLTSLDVSHNKLLFIDYDKFMSDLPSLQFLNIKFNNLPCGILAEIISYLENKNVSYTVQEVLAANKVNVGGIYCREDVVKPKAENHIIFNISLGFVILLVIVITSIIVFKAYIYLKRRHYRADEFELIQE